MIRTLSVERLSLFRRWLPTDVYLWLKAILITLIVIQSARLFWVIITPVGPFGDWRPTAPRSFSSSEQVALLSSVNPFERDGSTVMAAGPAVSLILYGVRAGGIGGGGAILGTADGEQVSYSIGDEVAPGVRLRSVAFDHVVLDQGGRQQTLFMPDSDTPAAAPSVPGPESPMTASGMSPDTARAGLSLRPRMVGGRVTGALVDAGANAAVIQASGFRPGDVIVAVNGARISSAIDVEQLQSSIQPGARLMLSVERGAQIVPIALNVPGSR